MRAPLDANRCLSHAAGYADLRFSHGYVFQHLIDAQPTVGELAAKLAMTQQGVSKAVAELDRLGYTERVADPGDARIRRVRLHRTRPDRRGGGRRARTELDELLRRRSGTRRLAECHSLLAELLDELGGTVAVRHREVPMPH